MAVLPEFLKKSKYVLLETNRATLSENIKFLHCLQ